MSNQRKKKNYYIKRYNKLIDIISKKKNKFLHKKIYAPYISDDRT